MREPAVAAAHTPNAAIPNEIKNDRAVSIVELYCAESLSILVNIDVRNGRESEWFLRGRVIARLNRGLLGHRKDRDGAGASEFGEGLSEKAKSIVGQPRFAGFATCNFFLEIGFEFAKRPLEFVGSTHHLAGFPDAFDRLFQDGDRDGGHNITIR
jgi:hypothetical protein